MNKESKIYIFSTMAAGVVYPITKPRADKSYDIVDGVEINGGHGVATKHFITPQGVMTTITQEQYDLIKDDATFKMHKEGGFITVSETPADPEVVVADMERSDGSAPLTPEDYVEGADGAKPMADKKVKK